MEAKTEREGLTWQIDVWDKMSQVYGSEIDKRFSPVVQRVLSFAKLKAGEHVLDLGTGTGAVALRAANLVAPQGQVVAIDISREMLAQAEHRAAQLHLTNISFREGRAEAIPAPDGEFDVVVASLSLMYVIDRAAAAREIARVLKPGGRFVAAVWAGPDECDIVKFQQIAGSFGPAPPVPGVSPWALADPSSFLTQLADAGITASVIAELTSFDFDDLESAWNALASVSAANLSPDRGEEAKAAVKTAMWPDGDGPRHFRNLTQFIIGERL